jgi:ABC-type transporter Mla subunit MlaD
MAGWQVPGISRVPGLTELLTQIQAQTDALKQLPVTVADLTRAILDLTDVMNATRETVASAQRVSEHLERAIAELDEPVRALRPGLERVAKVLDDPAVDTVPETLRRLQDSVVPLVEGLRQSQARLENIAARLRPRRKKDAGTD